MKGKLITNNYKHAACKFENEDGCLLVDYRKGKSAMYFTKNEPKRCNGNFWIKYRWDFYGRRIKYWLR